jgi:trimeric autotransporter adhesin
MSGSTKTRVGAIAGAAAIMAAGLFGAAAALAQESLIAPPSLPQFAQQERLARAEKSPEGQLAAALAAKSIADAALAGERRSASIDRGEQIRRAQARNQSFLALSLLLRTEQEPLAHSPGLEAARAAAAKTNLALADAARAKGAGSSATGWAATRVAASYFANPQPQQFNPSLALDLWTESMRERPQEDAPAADETEGAVDALLTDTIARCAAGACSDADKQALAAFSDSEGEGDAAANGNETLAKLAAAGAAGGSPNDAPPGAASTANAASASAEAATKEAPAQREVDQAPSAKEPETESGASANTGMGAAKGKEAEERAK